jgi:hypothetical protein
MTKINLKRYNNNNKGTSGIIFVDKEYFFTFENPKRKKKIPKDTRIPAGFYEIKFRKVLSKKTKDYRKKYKWFEWHLELQNVPGYKYVYLHIGNEKKDTDACILIGMGAAPNRINSSTIAFEKFYKIISEKINKNEQVFIEIKDEG